MKSPLRLPFVVGITIGVLAVVIAVVVGAKMTSKPNVNDRVERIRIGVTPYLLNLPSMELADKEIDGIPVDIVEFTSTDSMGAAFLRGDVDMASSLGLDQVLSYASDAGEIPGYALCYNTLSSSGIHGSIDAVVVRDAPGEPQSLADLEGKVLATFRATSAIAYWETIVNGAQVSPASIKELQPADLLPALARGEVDAILLIEPLSTIAAMRPDFKVIAWGAIPEAAIDPLYVGVHVVRKELIDNMGFSRAELQELYDTTVAELESEALEARAAASRRLPVPHEVLENIRIPTWATISDFDASDLKASYNFLISSGIVSSAANHDLSSLNLNE